jgi:AcrR family transcriptional regulator
MSGRKQFDVDQALDRAMEIFWERGYAETSLDLLGSATGLGKGSLYGTFGGKEPLFRQALDRYAQTFGRRYEEALALHPKDPVAAVAAFYGVVLDRIVDPTLPGGCLIALSASQVPTLDPASQEKVRELLARQRRRIRAAFPRPDDVEPELDNLACFVVAVNQSLAVMNRAGASLEELRAIVRTATAAVASGLAEFGV